MHFYLPAYVTEYKNGKMYIRKTKMIKICFSMHIFDK